MLRWRSDLTAASLLAAALAGCAEGKPGSENPDATASAVDASVDPDAEYCDLTMQDEKPGECARFQRQYADLDAGRDAITTPLALKEGETRTVSYAVSRLPEAVQGGGGTIRKAVRPVPRPTMVPRPAPPLPPDEMVVGGASPPPGAEATPSPVETPDAAAGESGAPDPAITPGGEDAGAPLPAPSPVVSAAAPTAEEDGPTQEDIDAAIAATDAQNRAALGVTSANESDVANVKVARTMYACLTGSLAIEILGEECQSRDTRRTPRPVWQWNVRAKEPGNYTLNLASGVEVRTRSGEPRQLSQRAIDRRIEVSVTALGWFQRAMASAVSWLDSPLKAIGALTALLLAIGGLRAAFRKARRGEGGKD